MLEFFLTQEKPVCELTILICFFGLRFECRTADKKIMIFQSRWDCWNHNKTKICTSYFFPDLLHKSAKHARNVCKLCLGTFYRINKTIIEKFWPLWL
jgi:hypothetical protein